VVTNTGTTPLDGVSVTDSFSTNPDFSSDTYTSTPTGGATGNTSPGSGDISDTLDLPPGSSVTYYVDAVFSDNVFEVSSVSNTATATPPSGSPVSATDVTDLDFGGGEGC
jgi:hypothetical protein